MVFLQAGESGAQEERRKPKGTGKFKEKGEAAGNRVGQGRRPEKHSPGGDGRKREPANNTGKRKVSGVDVHSLLSLSTVPYHSNSNITGYLSEASDGNICNNGASVDPTC